MIFKNCEEAVVRAEKFKRVKVSEDNLAPYDRGDLTNRRPLDWDVTLSNGEEDALENISLIMSPLYAVLPEKLDS